MTIAGKFFRNIGKFAKALASPIEHLFGKSVPSLVNKLTGSGLTSAEIEQNQFNADEAQKARDFTAGQNQLMMQFNADEAQKARDFNMAEAQKARDYNTEVMKNQTQWHVQDMKAAGVNPALMMGGSTGMVSASGASASGPAASGASGSGAAASSGGMSPDTFSSFISTMLQNAIAKRQLSLDSKRIENERVVAESQKMNAETNAREVDQNIKESNSRMTVNASTVKALEQQVKNGEADEALARANIDKAVAERDLTILQADWLPKMNEAILQKNSAEVLNILEQIRNSQQQRVLMSHQCAYLLKQSAVADTQVELNAAQVGLTNEQKDQVKAFKDYLEDKHKYAGQENARQWIGTVVGGLSTLVNSAVGVFSVMQGLPVVPTQIKGFAGYQKPATLFGE